jgi:hypothetical protein
VSSQMMPRSLGDCRIHQMRGLSDIYYETCQCSRHLFTFAGSMLHQCNVTRPEELVVKFRVQLSSPRLLLHGALFV